MSKKANKQLKSVILEVLKEVASTKAHKSESDYVFTDEKITTQQKKIMSEKISKFGHYQKYISIDENDVDLAEDICNIIESATKYITDETTDWFDAMSVNRNIKEIKILAKEFYKTANERKLYTQRMQSLYEDMGNILNRYFDLTEKGIANEPKRT